MMCTVGTVPGNLPNVSSMYCAAMVNSSMNCSSCPAAAERSAEDKAALAEETPVGRLGTPEEVAKLLVFLAGEDAGYITGQVFGVNGGLVI